MANAILRKEKQLFFNRDFKMDVWRGEEGKSKETGECAG